MDDPSPQIRTAPQRARARAAAQRVKHRRAGSWQPMTAARSGKLLKVVTSNFRELVASIQGKVEKISPMHLCTYYASEQACDPPPAPIAAGRAEAQAKARNAMAIAAVTLP
jgi:hypothetical protein